LRATTHSGEKWIYRVARKRRISSEAVSTAQQAPGTSLCSWSSSTSLWPKLAEVQFRSNVVEFRWQAEDAQNTGFFSRNEVQLKSILSRRLEIQNLSVT